MDNAGPYKGMTDNHNHSNQLLFPPLMETPCESGFKLPSGFEGNFVNVKIRVNFKDKSLRMTSED